MTVLEFLSDRLGRLVMWGSCTALAAGILLATGTSPGVLILLLAALFLVFLAAQAQAFQRMRRTIETWERLLEAELDQIGAHVERALFYARAENPEKDVLIHPANLSDLVNQAVQAHRALLLQNGVSVELCDLDFVVYTDRKWVCFLLGQLLQNAARYRRARPVIILSARRQEKRVELTVSDNGMGIPAHELPRVFDRGFTGSNGRLRGGSTGMGLYLAKKLADALEISLAIRSEEGVGTQVLLTFPAQEKLTKL